MIRLKGLSFSLIIRYATFVLFVHGSMWEFSGKVSLRDLLDAALEATPNATGVNLRLGYPSSKSMDCERQAGYLRAFCLDMGKTPIRHTASTDTCEHDNYSKGV